jgi:hypothetical protein
MKTCQCPPTAQATRGVRHIPAVQPTHCIKVICDLCGTDDTSIPVTYPSSRSLNRTFIWVSFLVPLAKLVKFMNHILLDCKAEEERLAEHDGNESSPFPLRCVQNVRARDTLDIYFRLCTGWLFSGLRHSVCSVCSSWSLGAVYQQMFMTSSGDSRLIQS